MVKNLPANAGGLRHGFDPWLSKIPWRRSWQPTPVFLPGGSYGQRRVHRFTNSWTRLKRLSTQSDRGRGYWEVTASSEQSLHPWDWCPNKNCVRKLLTPSSMWEYDKKISKNQEVGLTRHRTLPCLTLISIWFPDPRNVADIFVLFLSHLLCGILL